MLYFFAKLILTISVAAEPSFRCAAKQLRDEKLICSNPTLSELDFKMAEAYKAANLKDSGRFNNVLKEKQKVWLRVRKLCGEVLAIEHATRCLVALYEEHIDDLLETGAKRHLLAPAQSQPTASNGGERSEFITDGIHVYYAATKWLLPDSDAKTFVSLGHGYAKDAHHVYQYNAVLHDADPKTFTLLEPQLNFYGKDAYHVYDGFDLIPTADPKSFTSLAEGYSKDANHVFKDHEIIAGLNPKDFSIEGTVVRSGSKITINDVEFPGADAPSFKIVQQITGAKNESIYARDKANVYYFGGWSETQASVIKGADPSTFKVLDDQSYFSQYAKDATSVYYGRKRVEKADPNSFKDLNPYAFDAKLVFFEGIAIMGADPKTFERLEIKTESMNEGLVYARDARMVFYRGVKIPKADLMTFRAADGSSDVEALDKNYRYSSGAIVGRNLKSH